MKLGFKLTDVGAIPDDWEAVNLGDRASFRTGPFGSALHKSDYTEDGVPVINPMHIIDGKITPTRTMTITEDAAKKLSEFRLKAGQVILGRRGDMGRCAVIQNHQDGWLCGTGSVVIRCDSKTNADYLQRVISSPKVVSSIEQASVGSTMINLNQGTLSKLRIQLPPLSEQRAIAQALGDVDALIAALDRLIAKKRDIKQATMQQLLTGKTRLPGFSGKWEIKPLKELGNCFAGGTPATSRRDYWGGSIYWLPSGRVQDCILSKPKDDEATITSMGVAESAAKVIKPPAVLIAITGATCGNVAMLQFAAAANQSVVAIEPNETTCAGYLYYSLLTERNQMLSMQSGSAQGGINLKAVKSLYVQCPPLIEQAAISAVLSDMDAELTALEARRDKTRALKQGMMQELLTGKTRLI